MKTILNMIIALIIAIISTTAYSQTIVITETNLEFEKKLRPCLSADIDPQPTEVKKSWAKYLDKNFKIDVSGLGWFSNKDIITAQDVMLGIVSDKRQNIYARILETPTGTEMKLFASFGYDLFIGKDEYPNEFENLKKLFYNFLMEYLTEYYADKIAETSKTIDKNNREKVKLLKSIEKNKENIADAKKDIEKLNAKKSETSEESIKLLEKINKLNKKQLELENENVQSNLTVQELDNANIELNSILQILLEKQKGLLVK